MRPDDIDAVQRAEVRAGERFRDVGLGHVADHEPASDRELHAAIEAGTAWVVAVDPDDRAAGYVLTEVLDDAGHVEQMTVDPDEQGRGLGRQLMDRASTWASEAGFDRLTLTTFRDVEWNRPLYEHLGFRVLGDDEIGAGLAARVAEEAEHGLDPATRCCMELRLRP